MEPDTVSLAIDRADVMIGEEYDGYKPVTFYGEENTIWIATLDAHHSRVGICVKWSFHKNFPLRGRKRP
jgi:hypothetical protein